MIKKYFAVIAILLCSFSVRAQVLGVPQVIQEQDQWCWAGCTKCILNYYGYAVSECTIADYTRTVATWHSFGTTNCCVDATLGCNYWNYNIGFAGSIQDILVHFDHIGNTAVSGAFSTTQIASEIAAHHAFVEHWSWSAGGGHFVVGQGISGSGSTATIYYMNPWFGEGLHFCNYTWMVAGTDSLGDHTWDATNQITSLPVTMKVNEPLQVPGEFIYPNPSTGEVFVNGAFNDRVEVRNTAGVLVYNGVLKSSTDQVNLEHLPKGMYIIKLSSADGNKFSKLILQ